MASKAEVLGGVWSYLQLEDVTNASSVSADFRIVFSAKRKCTLRQCGVGEQHRPGFWAFALGVTAAQKSMLASHGIECVSRLYLALVMHGCDTPATEGHTKQEDIGAVAAGFSEGMLGSTETGKARLRQSGQEGEIFRDVGRTFPTTPLFEDEDSVGQHLLVNVLSAFASAHSDIG